MRPVLARAAVAAVLITLVGWTSTAAAAARTPKPTIAGYTVSPTTVAGPSGYVHLAATVTGASSCAFTTTTPGATLTPAVGSCASGTASSTLFVPENSRKKPEKVRVTLTATGPGGVKSAHVTLLVDPGAGGRSLPGAPTSVVATASDTSATVTVTPPSADGGEPIASYTVTAIDVTSAAGGGQTASASSSPLTVTGLVDGDAYRFTATATSEIGTSPPSADSNEVVPDVVPGVPTDVSAVAGDGDATVSFVGPGDASADTTYQVVTTDLTTSANGGQTTSAITSPVTVVGLTDGDSYVFTVQATDSVGPGPASSASNQVVPDAVPGAPTDLTATAGDGQATVSFAPPGDAPTGTTYEVEATDQTTPADGGQTASGPSPVTVTGLADGDTYAFTVTARAGSVDGTPSTPSNTVVPTVGSQPPAQQAVGAGETAYVAAVNADPDLAQCSTGTDGSGTCTGAGYGTWYPVADSDSDSEYYAFGNPQPTFDPSTHAIDHLSVQVVGAAVDPSATDGYTFEQATITLTPTNGFLDTVWWSNLESFSETGDYAGCDYDWSRNSYDADDDEGGCSPIYFGPGDYLFGPLFTNDSIFVTGDTGGPSFGTPGSPSAVQTADPNCLFVDDSHGMSGSDADCSLADGDVALFDAANSTYGHPVEAPPSSDAKLATVAAASGCLYSGPTQITLSTTVVDGRSVGRMTVISPDTTESTVSDAGTPVTWDDDNITTNYNNCPNDGTADLPAGGVVYVENATSSETVTGANPFDDLVADTVTDVTADPSSPVAGQPVTLTATVTSSVSQIGAGATVDFGQTTSTTVSGHTTTSSSAIAGCASMADWSTPVLVDGAWQSSVTCTTVEATDGTGSFSADYSGGTYTGPSEGTLGQSDTLSPGVGYGPNSQTTAGGCDNCYYGETAMPDAEGDAFVSGDLSGQFTIGTQNDVVIDGNLTYADCSGNWTTGQSGLEDFCPYSVAGPNDSLGLVADSYVEVNHPVASTGDGVLASCDGTAGALCDPATPGGALVDGTDQSGITIDAAILALNESFLVNNFDVGSAEGKLAIYGSVQQFARGPVGTFGVEGPVSGYTKNYTWDPLLTYLAPPGYLTPSTPSWALDTVDADGATGSGTSCPPLTGIYAGTDEAGVVQDGPADTQSCSAATGGLPDFPSGTAQ